MSTPVFSKLTKSISDDIKDDLQPLVDSVADSAAEMGELVNSVGGGQSTATQLFRQPLMLQQKPASSITIQLG
jgi:hypothetical protein